ncbi:ATP-dependent DNA helicase [Clostridium malenominatum]|uniref:ATP-dependent DNA helicase n=2 Tax=Clostridium malenominatum TaxID=1539 RepID=A0ABN1J4X4_9CLOT
MSKEFKVSVRNLVEFIMRSGDIDSTFVGGGRALEGTRIHQKIQKNKGENYRAEVSLKYTFNYEDVILSVEGRADGIIEEDGMVIIDEIKSTTRDLEKIEENYNPLHMAQGKCYAYIYGRENNLEKIGVQLTYCNVETKEIKIIPEEFYLEELENFFYDLIDKYYVWIEFQKEWNEKRDLSIKNLDFPFSKYRKGQRELAVSVYKTIREGKNIFLQAPTGVGKTISTIFPTVKAMGEGLAYKIFYLTAKNITSSVALEGINIMSKKGLYLKTLSITSKEKICFKDKATCNGEQCEYAKGHYDRVNEAVLDLLNNESLMDKDIIQKYALKHRVCPFEFSLDVALWSDLVICDYNYVFDPRVYLKRFFDGKKEDYVFLIDEAHNLVDRGRDMFSASLSKEDFLKGKKITKDLDKKLYKKLDKVNSYFIELGKKFEGGENYILEEEPLAITSHLRILVEEMENWLKIKDKSDEYEHILKLYFDCLAFIRISELYDENFIVFCKRDDRSLLLTLFCLDPSKLLRESVKKGRAGVFFSATLSPMNYFMDLLGGDKEDFSFGIPSPFDNNNRKIIIAGNISTRYKNRDNSIGQIVEYIKTFIKSKKGNYLVFFPSYMYMEKVLEKFKESNEEVEILVQNSAMKDEERGAFLEKFVENPEKTMVAFSVLGGMFSEGIDLKGERLSGAVIVGVGLPQICFERDIIMKYFDKNNGRGYDYSYVYPGVNKVLQGAGRVIRTEEDRGAILLIDDRFASRAYQSIFPKEWGDNRVIYNRKDLDSILCDFW